MTIIMNIFNYELTNYFIFTSIKIIREIYFIKETRKQNHTKSYKNTNL